MKKLAEKKVLDYFSINFVAVATVIVVAIV